MYRCGNSLQCVEGKTKVIRGCGLNASGDELIETRDIAKGDVVAVFGKTATLWTSNLKDVHEFEALVDVTNNDPCGQISVSVDVTLDKFQYNVRGHNPENKILTLYIVPEKDAELALSMKPSECLAKALRDPSVQSGNSQFANHTCCTMHTVRNINIKIVTVQAAADDEHLNPITTVKPDVIVILCADRGIVMGEWIKHTTRMYS